MIYIMKDSRKVRKMTKGEKELSRIMEIASNVVVEEDLAFLKELAKY